MINQKLKSEKENEKIEFRKRIKRFVLDLILFIDHLPHERVCKVIGDQLIRSGTSIGANYFESRGASSRNNFANFFSYSLKSANESKFWLEVLIEAEKCNVQEAQVLLGEVTELANIFASSLLTLRAKR